MTSSPEKALEFALKLANARNLGDNEAIVDQIVAVEPEKDFPGFFDRLDPDQAHSETKVLPPYAKERLRLAIEKYVDRVRQSH